MTFFELCRQDYPEHVVCTVDEYEQAVEHHQSAAQVFFTYGYFRIS